MTIPPKLEIGGHEYDVRILEGWQDGETLATEDSTKNQIVLDEALTQSRR